MPRTILITGATGNISSGIQNHLKGSGHTLRALVRDPGKAEALKRQGVDVRIGDLEMPWTLAPAFEGAFFPAEGMAQCPESTRRWEG